MSSELIIETHEEDDCTEYKLTGSIDEDSNFESISVAKNQIVFNLEEVSLINSCGIREWIKFQDTIDINCKISYKNCPQIIVEQMNIIKGFVRSGGNIVSFFAPYYDEKSDTEIKKLIKPIDVIDGKAPIFKNDDGALLEFDDIEAQYFNFLKNA